MEWSVYKMSKELNPDILHSNYLELFFKQSQDAISVFDMNNNIITCNPAFEKLYGWTLQECVGKSIPFYAASECLKVEKRQKLLFKGQSLSNIQVTEQRKDGSLFQAEISMTPIFNEHKEVVAISNITRDITAKLQLEQNKQEIERLQTISAIAANVAHEVRNPMTAINGFIQMMNQDTANPYAFFTEIMESEINRVNQIVTDFLVLSKPTLHDSSSLSIVELIKEIIIEFNAEFERRAIACHLHSTQVDFNIHGSKSSLHQVFHNLLSNSCDAIGHTGTITITLTSKEDALCICIEDNGVGMDKETLESIDQPFFSTKESGTGLGILISKKIIVDHKGTLQVESQQSAWTKIWIHLPLTNETLH